MKTFRHTTPIKLVFLFFSFVLLQGCLAVKDSDGNTIHLDGHRSTVTTPDGNKIFDYDSTTGQSTSYDPEYGTSERTHY